MQDLSSGEMRDLTPFLKDVPKVDPTEFMRLAQAEGKLADELQKAKDAVQPDRSKQGPVFAVGEVLEIRGGKFKVHAIAGNRLYLDSIPSR